MAQTSWSINAGTAALWLFSSALAPHTSAMPATMTSSGWPVSPKRNCPIVLQVLLTAFLWKNKIIWKTKQKTVERYIYTYDMLFLFFLSQGQKASSWREQSAPCTWFTHQQGRSLPWAVGCAGMPTPSKPQDSDWKPVCLLWFLPVAETHLWSSALAWSSLLDTGPSFCSAPRVLRVLRSAPLLLTSEPRIC